MHKSQTEAKFPTRKAGQGSLWTGIMLQGSKMRNAEEEGHVRVGWWSLSIASLLRRAGGPV